MLSCVFIAFSLFLAFWHLHFGTCIQFVPCTLALALWHVHSVCPLHLGLAFLHFSGTHFVPCILARSHESIPRRSMASEYGVVLAGARLAHQFAPKNSPGPAHQFAPKISPGPKDPIRSPSGTQLRSRFGSRVFRFRLRDASRWLARPAHQFPQEINPAVQVRSQRNRLCPPTFPHASPGRCKGPQAAASPGRCKGPQA